jgi:hypothetical protein
MARHKWIKKGKRPYVYWECEVCGCEKQKEYGMPWEYFLPGDRWPSQKAPECKIHKIEIK